MIVAGLGFRAGATAESFASALDGWPHPPDALATAEAKQADPALLAFAARRGLAVIAIPAEILRAQTTLTHSDAAQAAYGTGSVAEAAAIAAVGPAGRLLGARVISADRYASCALARSAPNGDTPDASALRVNDERDPA